MLQVSPFESRRIEAGNRKSHAADIKGTRRKLHPGSDDYDGEASTSYFPSISGDRSATRAEAKHNSGYFFRSSFSAARRLSSSANLVSMRV